MIYTKHERPLTGILALREQEESKEGYALFNLNKG